MTREKFGQLGFVMRWLLALLLVALTFNPSGYSYFHWITQSTEPVLSLQVLVGLIILVLFVIYLRATWRSIGIAGMVLVLAVLGALIWLFVEIGLLKFDGGAIVSWVAILVVATLMGIGISWSHIRRRLTGQIDADDVSD